MILLWVPGGCAPKALFRIPAAPADAAEQTGPDASEPRSAFQAAAPGTDAVAAGRETAPEPAERIDAREPDRVLALDAARDLERDRPVSPDAAVAADTQPPPADTRPPAEDTGRDTAGANHVCAQADEHQTLTLACPAGLTIRTIVFASYGTPTGTCGAFAKSDCHSAASVSAVSAACLGKPSCAIGADNGPFGDPCTTITKRLAVEVTCDP